MLHEDGHRVVECSSVSGLAELQRLQEVDILVCAHDMPVENGLWLVDRLHAVRPAVPAILVAPYRPVALDDELATRPFAWLVEKPVDYDTMHWLIHELTQRFSGFAGNATIH